MVTEIMIAIMAAVLVILYKNLPNRKIFIYFCVSLIIVFGISAMIGKTGTQQEQVDETARQALMQEQKKFVEWYSEYQREIERLDRNWQLYHNVVNDFESEMIDVDTLAERLMELENDSRLEQVNVYTLKPPEGLGAECEVVVEQLIRKTQVYADAQTQTIALTKQAAEQIYEPEELLRMVQNIMIRESPAGLFTASELSAILSYFSTLDSH